MTNIIENNHESLNLPVIALRGLVVFPNLSIQFDVGRKKSILAISAAMEHNQKIFLVAQKYRHWQQPCAEQDQAQEQT